MKTTLLAASALFLLGVGNVALANQGVCRLSANDVNGTHGFSASGIATAATPFAPAGPFAQAGIVSHLVERSSGNTLSGRWAVSLTQNDTSGQPKSVQFGGTFNLDTTTCGADLILTSPAPLAAQFGQNFVFREIFVDDGKELRTLALIPGVIISYTSAKKL